MRFIGLLMVAGVIGSTLSTRQQEPTAGTELSPFIVEMFEYIV